MHKAFGRGALPGMALMLATLLGGCASSAQYPSFALPEGTREAEAEPGRVAISFPGVAVPALRSGKSVNTWSEELPGELDARLAAINMRAMAANRAFAAGLGPVQRLARMAAGRPVESDEWSTAQVRLADLISHHSNAQLALAEVDRLAAGAELAASPAGDAAAIAELKTKLAEDVGEQAQLLGEINAQLVP
jgi:hypothetical protein